MTDSDTALPRPPTPVPENICSTCKGAGENIIDGVPISCEPCNGTGLTAGTQNYAEVLKREGKWEGPTGRISDE